MASETGPFAQETIQIDAAAYYQQPAVDVTLNLTYDTTQTAAEKRQGAYEVTAGTGTYTELSSTGAVEATYPVTMLLRKHLIGGDNDRLYLDSSKISTLVDRHGLSFEIGDATTTRPHHTQRLNFFEYLGHGTATKDHEKSYELYANYHDRMVTSVTVTPGSSADTTEGTVQSDSAAVCFASGTRLRTARGEIAVEALAIGDLVLTASGALRPIRWLGHRTVDCRRHAKPALVQPVRVAAHAFGADLPARDLVVSPGHAICVDVMGEALVPAGVLVNGTSVTQLDVARVTYWHVELDAHDIVIAENLPAESYLEMGNRGFFAESAAVVLAAAPDVAVATHADFCRPFHADGPLVDAVRARLATRAAPSLQSHPENAAAA